MDSFCRWVAKHQKTVYYGLALLLGVLIAVLMLYFDLPALLGFALGITGVHAIAFSVAFCCGRFQEQTRKIMTEQCDPYPFLNELRTQLSYDNLPFHNAALRINFAAALHNTGSTQAALDVMRQIPLAQKKSASPALKAIYCNNLATYLQVLEDSPAAEDAYRQFRALAAEKKADKYLKKYSPSLVPMAEVEQLYRQGEYTAALERSRAIPVNSAYDRVHNTFLQARCSIALGDPDTARQALRFVIDHGNRLAVVDRAKALLDTL